MLLFISNLLILILSLLWFVFSPDWEPAIVFIGTLLGLVTIKLPASIRKKVEAIYFKKINIKNGEIIDSDNKILEIIKPLCAGESANFKVIDLDAKGYLNSYKKSNDPDDVKLFNKKYYDRLISKCGNVEEAITIVAKLYYKRYINTSVDDLPNIVRNYISIVYPASNGKPKFFEPRESESFDIYSNSVIEGKILSFIADFPKEVKDELFEMLNVKSSQELAIPNFFSVLQIPESTYHNYVIPAQINAALTRYKDFRETDEFWGAHNWTFGPH